MHPPAHPLLGTLALLALVAGVSIAQQDSSKTDDGASASQQDTSSDASTVKATRERLRIELELNGVFESVESSQIVFRPKVWTNLQVTKAVEHGARVVEGDPLVWLETEQLDHEIMSVEQSLELGQLSLEQQRFAVKQLEESVPLDLAAAQRAKAVADEELTYFLETDRAHSEESARFSLDSAKYRLEYAQEELNQLQKMYEADDLTEETEEIILKRAQRAVESAEFSLRSAELRTQRTLNTELPRKEKDLSETAQRQVLSLAKAQATLPVSLQQARIELANLELEQQQSDKKLARLKHDRELMVMRAPRGGIVYYGDFKRGKWQGMSGVESQLQPGGKIAAGKVLMSVVSPGLLQVRIEVAERDLHHLREGIEGVVTATAFPDVRLAAKVKRVLAVPLAAGSFDAVVDVDTSNPSISLVPGLSCQANFVVHDNPRALVVSASALFMEDGQDFVYIVQEDGEQLKRAVVVEKRGEEKVEIGTGLKVGDKVLEKGRP